ncbi:MAG: SDR family oxidoreductase [Kiritimatiellia bacterium]
MEKSLKGKTALVTGSAARIGRSIAVKLAEEGADVIVHCNHSLKEAGETAGMIRNKGCRSAVIRFDLSRIEEVASFFSEAREAAGGNIDILINNASIFEKGHPDTLTADEFYRNMNIHALAPLQLCQCLASQKTGGDIINMLDTRILECDNEHAAYHLSKRTLFSLTRMLAKEFAPEIRVNGIAPGLVLPPPGRDDSYLRERAHRLPLNRHGTAADVSDAVTYLLKSSFVTGQVIYIDGGKHLRGNSYIP